MCDRTWVEYRPNGNHAPSAWLRDPMAESATILFIRIASRVAVGKFGQRDARRPHRALDGCPTPSCGTKGVAALSRATSLHFPFDPVETSDIETPRSGSPVPSHVQNIRGIPLIWSCRNAIGQCDRLNAGMVKLVDTPDLGSGAARRGSSSLSTRTRTISRPRVDIRR